MQVVPSPEYLEVVPVGDQRLGNLIDLLWLLRLSTSLAEDDIALYVEAGLGIHIAPDTHETGLLSMLQIIAMALSYLPIHCLLHPSDLINEPIKDSVKIRCAYL